MATRADPEVNRVEPADARGMGIRIPMERLGMVADLLAPAVPRARVIAQADFVTLYVTVGRDELDGRRVGHRWTNVIGLPPAGIPEDAGIGGIAYIGSPSSPIGMMWTRVGQVVVPGRVGLRIDRRRRTAEARIATAGGELTATAHYPDAGTRWAYLPQRYCLMDPARPILYAGDEWGEAHDTAGIVRSVGPGGSVAFEAEMSVDLAVGWDYVFRPIPIARWRDAASLERAPEPRF
jgi:hypothetical protein